MITGSQSRVQFQVIRLWSEKFKLKSIGMDDDQPSSRETFLYFGYASNLWTNRLRMQNLSAIRKTTATLKGYRLDFAYPDSEPTIWNGPMATIVKDDTHFVWGAVWEIDLTHLASLDCQEGVLTNKYIPFAEEVQTVDGDVIKCRLYRMRNPPQNKVKLNNSSIPNERKPSKTYITTIIKGAEESKLPEEYVEFLKKIAHTDREASPELLAKLKLNGD